MPPKMTRRAWLRLGVYGTLLGVGAYAFVGEHRWLRVRRLAFAHSTPCRIVQLSDIHYKGDQAYWRRVIQQVNTLQPDLVCFTGDLVEDANWLPEALEILRHCTAPVYGVPGNHEHWSHAPVDALEAAFEATGGAWLTWQWVDLPDYNLVLIGADEMRLPKAIPELGFRLLLTHYPAHADRLGDQHFDLILAGHSHGGQIRIPFYGAPLLPGKVGPYDRGLFHTPAGPLYVNPGIGTYYINLRFACRPEITVFDLGG